MKPLLFILIYSIAVTSALSKLLIIYNPDGRILNLSIRLLEEIPSKDFRILRIVLTVMVGITNSVDAFFIFKKYSTWYNLALAGVIMICG